MPEIYVTSGTHGDHPSSLFVVTNDNLIRPLQQAMFAYFIANLLATQIGLDAQAGRAQLFDNIGGIFGLSFGNIHDHHLHRGQPHWESAGVMLDEDADKAFQRAEHGAMQHDRRMADIILADKLGAEPSRQGEVKLQGAALPDAAETIFQGKFDLRPVEGAFARL